MPKVERLYYFKKMYKETYKSKLYSKLRKVVPDSRIQKHLNVNNKLYAGFLNGDVGVSKNTIHKFALAIDYDFLEFVHEYCE